MALFAYHRPSVLPAVTKSEFVSGLGSAAPFTLYAFCRLSLFLEPAGKPEPGY